MKDNFLTVEEARILTAEARTLQGEYKREQTKAVLLSVREAAAKGQSSVTIYNAGCSDPILVERMEGLGYIVSVFSDQRDGDSMTISWE